MPVETRYFRSDQHTVNGLTANALLTSQSGTAGQTSAFLDRNCFGIRVWIRHQDGTEEEVTPGSAVAVRCASRSSGIYSATWNCPQRTLQPTDAIVIRVYQDSTVPPTYQIGEWVTEQLNTTILNSATWTVYYYVEYRYSYTTRHLPDCSYVIIEYHRWYFAYDTSTYNSRIENFTYGIAPPAPPVKRFIGDALAHVVV